MEKVQFDASSDRISELPEPIKHHILSYMTTKCAIQTSILSRNWRTVWTGLTRFHLNGSLTLSSVLRKYFRKNDAIKVEKELVNKKMKELYDFLDRVFGSITMLEELKLVVPNIGLETNLHLDSWLQCVVGFNVRKLEFDVDEWGGSSYVLPKSVLSCKSLTNLTLSQCKIISSSLVDTKLPSLRELRLVQIGDLNETVLERLLGNCMNLQSFTLKGCHGLTRLKVLGLTKLERLNVYAMLKEDGLESIEIDAPNLLDFIYNYERCIDTKFCRINMPRCENVKCLDIGSIQLAELTIRRCLYLQYLKISSQQLVTLTFVNCDNLEKIKLETINLEKFSFSGGNPMPIESKYSLKLRQAYVYLELYAREGMWHSRFMKFLMKLGQSEKLSLNFSDVEDSIIPEKIRMKYCPPLYGVKQLEVVVRAPPVQPKAIELVESLLWLAPSPESISLSYSDDSYNIHFSSFCKVLKLKYDEPLKEKRKCDCWESLPIDCWRHSLSEVLLESEYAVPPNSNSRQLLMNQDDYVDTKLANFFRQARIDGKLVSFAKVLKPKVQSRR